MTSLWECFGCTEIERTTIGRENGIGLINRLLLEKRRKYQLILVDIIDLKVGSFIKHLNTVAVGSME